MLLGIDRILLRVPHLAAAVRHYRDVMGLVLLKEDKRLASLKFPEGGELVLHVDPDLPAEAVYYLVDDVRRLFARRAELGVQFVQPPMAITRGYRAAIRDPFGNIMLIVDRSSETSPAAVEDAKPAGALFSGVVEDRLPVQRELLARLYEQVGRTADDLPYTPDFEKIFTAYAAQHREGKPTRQEVWRHLLNLRKRKGQLPKLGEARSRPPAVLEEDRSRLRQMLGEDIGKRDRLPYTSRFDEVVDEFNKTQPRPLSPHLVWRLVATLAK